MPQIAQIAATYASQAFWMLLVFGLIYFGIARGMLTKVGATVDARAKKVADDLAEAERARAAAQAAEATYLVEMNAARSDAGKIGADAKAAALADTDGKVKLAEAAAVKTLEAAETRISAAKAQAMAGVQQVASDAASAIIARLTGASVSDADVASAVQANLLSRARS
jgi:F-type H+-transporting ATPase subunit b